MATSVPVYGVAFAAGLLVGLLGLAAFWLLQKWSWGPDKSVAQANQWRMVPPPPGLQEPIDSLAPDLMHSEPTTTKQPSPSTMPPAPAVDTKDNEDKTTKAGVVPEGAAKPASAPTSTEAEGSAAKESGPEIPDGNLKKWVGQQLEPIRATQRDIESSSYDDLNGAACWGRVINSHWVINRMTSSIMWNLVGAYYHGTDWYASSMMTSVEPWSGHYEVNPVIWATAHVTQFTKVGWRYLANGSGSGELPHGGYYTAWVDPSSDDFTMNFVKISRDHASCTRPPLPNFQVEEEILTVLLSPSMRPPDKLEIWYSNFESYDAEPSVFKHSTVQVLNGKFSLKVPVGAMITVTTIKTGEKGSFQGIPPSSPSFPLDYADDFQSSVDSQNARWFADQIGSFEIHRVEDGKRSLKQMVPLLPIGWTDKGSRGPMTLIGMREWQDIKVQVSFRLPPPAGRVPADAACIGVRTDQMWKNGVVLCVNYEGHWELLNSGPPLQGSSAPATPIASGVTKVIGSSWHVLSLEVGGFNKAQGVLDGNELLSVPASPPLEPTGGSPLSSGTSPSPRWTGRPQQAALYQCLARPLAGLCRVQEQAWELLPSYQLKHESGLCASGPGALGAVTLEICDSTKPEQLFLNDYTLVRNTLVEFTSKAVMKPLAGDKNTKQLRNQYVAEVSLGYPMCLTACPKKDLTHKPVSIFT
eukprot:s4381_g1.t1